MSMGSLRVYLSRLFLNFFLKPVYPNMVAKKFQFIFIHATKQHFHLGSYHYHRGRKPISTQAAFCESLSSLAERGEGLWS